MLLLYVNISHEEPSVARPHSAVTDSWNGRPAVTMTKSAIFLILTLFATAFGKPSFNFPNTKRISNGVMATEAEAVRSVAKFAATSVSQSNHYGSVDLVRVAMTER